MSAASPILEVRDLARHYVSGGPFRAKKVVKAVDGVSFTIQRGETFGLVGESGCGKSTVGRTVLRLNAPTAGEVIFDGTDLARLAPAELRRIRPSMQMIFQDPYATLNPKRSIRSMLAETVRVHQRHSKADLEALLVQTIEAVGLSAWHLDRYPHEFSGGQRQRIAIARALILNPQLIVADEPVSALDVSVQSQIINLLSSLQRQRGLSYLFISHDLGLVRHIADRVAVMYFGRIVELAETEALFTAPAHPYAAGLIRAIPPEHPSQKRDTAELSGEMPDPANPPRGCAFAQRCPLRSDICTQAAPVLRRQTDGRLVACHHDQPAAG